MSTFSDNIKKIFSVKNDYLNNEPYVDVAHLCASNTFIGDLKVGKYADIYLWSILNKIFESIKNARFFDITDENAYTTLVANFLNDEIIHIIWNIWRDGIAVIDVTNDDLNVVDKYRINANGEVIIPNMRDYVVYYSYEYRFKRSCKFSIIKNELLMVDKFGSALDFLTSTYGSLCLITGKDLPINARDKEDLNLQFKNSLGINANKNQFIVAGKDLNMQQVSFDINGLDLTGKIDRIYLLLADFFNVPKNILSLANDATYENQQASLKRFYTDCLTPLCEIVLEIGRMIIRHSYHLIAANSLTYKFDNVDIFSDKSVFIDEVKGLLDLLNNPSLPADASAKVNDMIFDLIKNYQ